MNYNILSLPENEWPLDTGHTGPVVRSNEADQVNIMTAARDKART